MENVGSIAKFVRSKNAGPFWVTMDIFCDDQESYDRIKNSGKINSEVISKIYKVPENMVKIFFVDSIFVIKISIPRENPQGDKYERDMHAGQQYIELAEIEI